MIAGLRQNTFKRNLSVGIIIFKKTNKPPVMKTYLRLFVLLAFPAFLFSCSDKIEETYTVNEPVYLSYDDLRNSFKVAEGQDIVHPGKIYFKDNYIFVNEYQKGIHVIDNSDPTSPAIVKFIEIPGNVDMAIKDNMLYADSYVDLLAIDISDINNITEVKRILDAFPYMIPECEDGVVETVDVDAGVVVGWKATERRMSQEEIRNHYLIYPAWRDGFMFMAEYSDAAVNAGNGNSGTGGSLARFTVYDNYLYAVDEYMLRLFNISESADPKPEKEMYVGWNIETLFPYDQKLFLGSTTGMYIYSLADPANPEFVSIFWHASSCDPVVVEGVCAYVTLRAGNLCGDNQSLLNVIDISNLVEPKLLKEYPMEEPYGLGIDDGILFVCDGDAGLKIYDATDPMVIDEHMIAQYGDMNAWDVIPLGDILIMIGTDGLSQYDYSDPGNIRLLSVIPIQSLQHVFE